MNKKQKDEKKKKVLVSIRELTPEEAAQVGAGLLTATAPGDGGTQTGGGTTMCCW